MQTPVSAAQAAAFASTPLEASPCRAFTRARFVLRADGGFLAASHKVEGPPITLVKRPLEATSFVDLTSAGRRGQALLELGWRNLRIVEVAVPLPSSL